MTQQEELEELKDKLLNGEFEVEVGTGPMGDGPNRIVEVDYVEDVEFDKRDNYMHGEHVALEATLSVPAHMYDGWKATAVYKATEEYGFGTPESTVYGVQIDNPANEVTVTTYKEV